MEFFLMPHPIVSITSLPASIDHPMMLATGQHLNEDQHDAQGVTDHDKVTKIHNYSRAFFGSLPISRELQRDCP